MKFSAPGTGYSEPARAMDSQPARAMDSVLRRSERIKKRKADVLVVDTNLPPDTGPPPKDTDPRTYRQAMACSLRKQW